MSTNKTKIVETPKGTHVFTNSSGFVKPPQVKIIPYLLHFMFRDGLPENWGR